MPLLTGILAAIAPVGQAVCQEIVERADGAAARIVPGSDVQSLTGPLLRMVLSLAAVLALLAGCVWLLKRFRVGAMQSGVIQVVGGMSLGPKERLVLIRVADEEILVGVSPTGMRSLHVLKKPSGAGRFSLDMESR